MQREWSAVLQREPAIAWKRAQVIVVGQGRAGKTSFVRALRSLPFENTDSTVGVATDTVETTDVHKWSDMEDNEFEQVYRE